MYCSNCGKQIGADLKFCPQCGTPVKNSTIMGEIYVPLQRDYSSEQAETVLAAMFASDKNQGFLQKSVSIVITPQRLIIANYDSKLMADYQKEYKAKIESRGQKGLGKFWSMATSGHEFLIRYFVMQPEAILKERDKNYQFYNSDIQEIGISSKNISSNDMTKTQIDLLIKTNGKKYKYILNNATVKKETFEVLADIFGHRFERGNTKFF